MASHQNVSPEWKDKPPQEIQDYLKKNSLDYVNLALNVHGDLNIGNMIRSSHLCGCKKFVIFGRKQFDKRSSAGAFNYLPVERIMGIHNPEKIHFTPQLSADDYKLDEDCFYEYVTSNHYLPIFVELTTMSIPVTPDSLRVIFQQAKENSLIPLFIYGNETHGIAPNLLALRDRFPVCFSVYLKQMGVLPSFNVSNCLSILSYKVMETLTE